MIDDGVVSCGDVRRFELAVLKDVGPFVAGLEQELQGLPLRLIFLSFVVSLSDAPPMTEADSYPNDVLSHCKLTSALAN